jgi:hypothetical protein
MDNSISTGSLSGFPRCNSLVFVEGSIGVEIGPDWSRRWD